jgi:hypothetical protein
MCDIDFCDKSHGILKKLLRTLRFHNRLGIYWPSERLLVSQNSVLWRLLGLRNTLYLNAQQVDAAPTNSSIVRRTGVCVCPGPISYVSCTPSWLASAGSLEFVYSYCIRESICARYNTTWWVSHTSYWPPYCHLEAQILLCTVLVLSTCTVEPIVTIQLRNLHMKCAMCFVGFGRFDQQLSSYADWPFVRKVHLVFGSNPSKDPLCTNAEWSDQRLFMHILH